jgi:hypothetical protein
VAGHLDSLVAGHPDDLLQLRAGPIGVPRLPVAGSLVGRHDVHPVARRHAAGGQLDVPAAVQGGADGGLVRGLVRAEPDIPIRPEDLAGAELWFGVGE